VVAVAQRLRELDVASEQAGHRLTDLLEQLHSKHGDTTDHTQAVAEFAVAIGGELGLDERAIVDLELGALLHDVGKLSVPDRILKKASALTEIEWIAMRRHTASGERLLLPLLAMRDVLAIVRSHHERWDGMGYPDGLCGDAIPLGARIVAVADSFAAMLEGRSYRAARSHPDALAEILRHSGTQFDPICADALRRLMALGLIGGKAQVRTK
jgi:putative nucleotidyltransferase with HDIG domain